MNEIDQIGGGENEFGFEGDPSYRDGDNRPDAVRAFLAGFDQGDIWARLDSTSLGSSEDDGDVDLVDDSETPVSASDSDKELAVAALENISGVGGTKRRKKETAVRTFTAEDFEDGPQRANFMMIDANISALFDRKRKPDEVLKAAEWLFGLPDTPFTFDRSCANLGARKDVIRLRIHYEYWRLWTGLPFPFPFLVVPLPSLVEDEIYMLAGDEGCDIARAAWNHPGIRSKQLLETAGRGNTSGNASERHRKALELLASKYFMSQQGDNWYLTGRNPIVRGMDMERLSYRRSIHQVSWSRMF